MKVVTYLNGLEKPVQASHLQKLLIPPVLVKQFMSFPTGLEACRGQTRRPPHTVCIDSLPQAGWSGRRVRSPKAEVRNPATHPQRCVLPRRVLETWVVLAGRWCCPLCSGGRRLGCPQGLRRAARLPLPPTPPRSWGEMAGWDAARLCLIEVHSFDI